MKFKVHTAQDALRGRRRNTRVGFRRKALVRFVVQAAHKKKALGRIEAWTSRRNFIKAQKRLDNHSSSPTWMIDIGSVVKDKDKYERDMAAQLDATRVDIFYAGAIGEKAGDKLKSKNHIVVFRVWSRHDRLHPTRDHVQTLFSAYLGKYITTPWWEENPKEIAAATCIVRSMRPRVRQAIETKRILNDWFFGDSDFCPTCYGLYGGEGRCGTCCVECHTTFEEGEGEDTGLCDRCHYEDDYMSAVDY